MNVNRKEIVCDITKNLICLIKLCLNGVTVLPADIAKPLELRIDIVDGRFKELPYSIGDLESLRFLSLHKCVELINLQTVYQE